jgi:hypothetical protein
MDEKIPSQVALYQMLQNLKQMILDREPVYLGRNQYMIAYTDGEWQLIKITPAGNMYKTDMSINTLLYHLSNTEKS